MEDGRVEGEIKTGWKGPERCQWKWVGDIDEEETVRGDGNEIGCEQGMHTVSQPVVVRATAEDK